jgi:transposase
MAIAVQQIRPIAHLPLILGVLRRLEVATIIDRLIPPHPAHVLSAGRGVEALVLAILDALFAANLNQVFSAIALKALEVYSIPTPWLHQDTTTIALYGAYKDEPQTPKAPRPAYGHSKDGRADLKQVLLSLGVSGAGGIPLRLGIRDSNRSDSVETPLTIEECLALGLEGVCGIVADSKAYSRRILGLCLEQSIG